MTIGVDGNEANVKNRVGSGVYAFEMLWQFAKKRDFQFIVYLKNSPLGDLPKESANFKYKVFGPRKFWTQLGLPVKLRFGPKVDFFLTLGHYAPRFTNVPYAITIFDLSYLHYRWLFRKSDLYQLTNWTKYSIRGASHIFAISNSTKEDIVKNYKVDPSKITVTYIGYDKERFKPQPKSKIEEVKEKYKIVGDYIIFVGTLQPRKNVERLIEAYKKITQNSPRRQSYGASATKLKTQNLQLVIVGKKGWLYDSIFEQVKKLKLEDKVVFTDYVSDSDLPVLIAGSRVYVLPSLWEGFGIPVVEAQACGVPVVVSNTSSLPEIVRNSGVLVDPESVESIAEGIKNVFSDSKLRNELIKKGFENVKRFSWKKCAEETLNTVEKFAPN